jgi:hypothetical protein
MEGGTKMGLKEAWEKYQIAATFAEAGETEMARQFLEESKKEKLRPEKEDRRSHVPGRRHLKPSPVEG